MSEKDCGHSDEDNKKLVRLILIGVGGFVIAVLLVIFLFWVITKPSKPSFVLQDATLYTFNLSADSEPDVLTTSLQVTISSRNPNDKIGIYYEKVDIYASYRNQQITLPTLLPVTYQGHKDITVWSPFLYGESVPVAPYVAAALSQDLNAGMVLVNIKVDGKVKWKVGTWISGKYHLNANCPAYITFGDKTKGIATGAAIKYQFVQGCTVDV
ncbi:Late embryogenesis abundant protein [Melia azedarach]|uniref:Late embryogenesis abundant protein n=1 Tax=Melia azedarach TaxID=155640 RepID=A0ACC1YNA5_MELAZ|nr:Late embryogenesis abundant protein [Melia azedarach]